MSYEAWGDGDEGEDYDHLIEAGWLPSEEAEELRESAAAKENALRNCLLLAMREAHKAKDAESPWNAIIRFCSSGGVTPSPLRAEDSAGESRGS